MLYIIENIYTTIQTTIAFTFTLLQIYADCFNIDKKKNET